MKKNIFRAAAMATLAILCILMNIPFSERSNTKIFTLPGLPRPIAKAPVVITSAGQSTDTYIIHDISNQLMIRSFFMPQAEDIDIKDIKTIVFSVDYSSLGTQYKDISYDEEKRRISKLIKKAKDKGLTVLTIVLGGKQPNEKKTEELLKLIGNQTDYFIGLRGSGNEEILTELAENRDIPLTLVDEVNDISEPYASAFR